MKKYVNGEYIEMPAEEIAALERAVLAQEIREKNRPFTETEVSRMLISAQINTLSVDDHTALRMLGFYPQWAIGTEYAMGFKVQRNSKLWRCIQAHTAQEGWGPENATSLWEQINETHTGELSDPVPYEGNMALESGMHYIQNGVIYLCIRDTGNPVYNVLADLVGVYVEAV